MKTTEERIKWLEEENVLGYVLFVLLVIGGFLTLLSMACMKERIEKLEATQSQVAK